MNEEDGRPQKGFRTTIRSGRLLLLLLLLLLLDWCKGSGILVQ
jgi:hypothetical protein